MPLGMNPIAAIRFANLFSQPQDDNAPLYVPRTEDSDAYRASLSTMPNRANYAPSTIRKIGAVIAGIGSNNPAETSNSLASLPFNTAMMDWGQKTSKLREAAQLENQFNTNQRALALGTEQRRIQRDRAKSYQENIDNQKDTADKKIKIAEKNAETAAKRADAYARVNATRAVNSTTQIIQNKQDGKYYLFNKETKETKPFDVDGLSEQELQDLKTQGHIKEIDARAGAATDLENQKQLGRERLEKLRQEGKIGPLNTHTDYEYDENGNIKKKTTTKDIKESKKSTDSENKEQVTVYDKVTGKAVATIPKADVARLNKNKYMVK